MTDRITITRIRPKRTGYLISISSLEEPLVCPEEVVFRYRLKEGIVLTASQLEELQAESELVSANNLVARLLGIRDHTVGEIRTKLIQRRVSRDVIDRTIKKHIDHGFLDDKRVAELLVGQAYRKKPSGRAYLVALLQRKMIARGLAEDTVNRFLESEDETEAAVKALRQKWPVPDQIEVETVRTKLYSYLARRGFGYQTARAAVAEHFESTGKVNED